MLPLPDMTGECGRASTIVIGFHISLVGVSPRLKVDTVIKTTTFHIFSQRQSDPKRIKTPRIDIMKLTHSKQDSLAKLLLEANASNSLDNSLGTVGTASKPVSRTPLRWAIEKGHWRITWDICRSAKLGHGESWRYTRHILGIHEDTTRL